VFYFTPFHKSTYICRAIKHIIPITMKRSIQLFLISVAYLLAMASCQDNEDYNVYADNDIWCCKPSKATENVDVFYIVSTNIMHSYKPDGSETFLSVLDEKDKATLATEINYIHESMFPKKVNFYAPYYHQVTMAAVESVSKKEMAVIYAKATKEVLDAFNYYMDNFNQGRPFILAGYSQGAIQVKNIVAQMPKEQLSRMVVAYVMGYGITNEQMANPNFKMATGATDTGVTLSFTSLANIDAKYSPINNTDACINPVNWHTDSTPAEFEYDGETLTSHVDEEHHVVIVDGFHYEKHKTQEWSVNPWSKENYHNFEIYFYAPSIRQNALDRIDAMVNAK